MKNYAVLGLGLMGKAICFDLLTFDPEAFVYGFERDKTRCLGIESFFSQYPNRFFTKQLELNLEDQSQSQSDELIKIFKDYNISVVFGAIDYKFNEYLTHVCISSHCSFLDLGGNPSVVKKQFLLDKQAKRSNITVIPDCGLAPGMANIIAAHVMDQFEELESCQIRVGGLPQNPKTVLKYQQVFSIRGLTNEYLEDAIVIQDGEVQNVESLTEIETLEFPTPWGTLEAFQTAGGTSNLPNLYKGKINDLRYKTIRYPGHCQFFKFLKDFGFLSSESLNKSSTTVPREITEYLLQQHLPSSGDDVVLVRVSVLGKVNGKTSEMNYELIDLYDKKTGFSAMARTTAFPISIIGQMIMKKVITNKGVLAGEKIVPKDLFLEELSKRHITFKSSFRKT